VSYLSTSAVLIHYEEALNQVYVPLSLPLYTFTTANKNENRCLRVNPICTVLCCKTEQACGLVK